MIIKLQILTPKKDTLNGHSSKFLEKTWEINNFNINKKLDLRPIRNIIWNIITFLISSLIQLVIYNQKRACPNCGHTLYKPTGEQKNTQAITSLGTAEITRYNLKCSHCGHRYWNIDNQPFEGQSIDMLELSSDLETTKSYQKTSDFLNKWFDVKRSDSSIMRDLHQLGNEIQAFYKEYEIPKLKEKPHFVLISGDATYYHSFPTGKKKAIWGGIVRSDKITKSNDRIKTIDKRYCFSTKDAIDLGDSLLDISKSYHIDKSKSFYASDGGNDVKGIRDRIFPNSKQILDWNHVSRKLFQCLTLIENTSERDNIKDSIKELLWNGRSTEAIDILQKKHDEYIINCKSDRDLKRLKNLCDYIHYLNNNINNLINYCEYQNNGLPIGSSEMEGAIDDLIAERVKKKKGRRFISNGINAIVSLFSIKLNNDWDKFFDYMSRKVS